MVGLSFKGPVTLVPTTVVAVITTITVVVRVGNVAQRGMKMGSVFFFRAW